MENLFNFKYFFKSVFLTLFIFIYACTTETSDDIFSKEWYNGKNLIIKNDSILCLTQYDTIADKLTTIKSFSLNQTDSTVVYTQFQKRGYYNEDKEFIVTHLEKVVDTIFYDLKYINNSAHLILYTEPFPLILKTKQEVSTSETNNVKQIKFRISNYTIGDNIDRSLIKTRGVYNYPDYTIEDCEFIENKDITFKIIGYNTIYSIERKHIENYRVDEIVKVVSSKLNIKPEYRPMRQWIDGSDYEYEFYRWYAHGVQINLSRSKYIGHESYKTLVKKDYWTLSYDDSFVQAILIEQYRNSSPKSSIIN